MLLLLGSGLGEEIVSWLLFNLGRGWLSEEVILLLGSGGLLLLRGRKEIIYGLLLGCWHSHRLLLGCGHSHRLSLRHSHRLLLLLRHSVFAQWVVRVILLLLLLGRDSNFSIGQSEQILELFDVVLSVILILLWQAASHEILLP